MRRSGCFSIVIGGLVLAASATAQEVTVEAGSVIPAVSLDRLSLKDSRPGDRFSVRAERSRDLPDGARFRGQVLAVRPAREGRPASMDLEFTEIELPSGERTRVRAVPIPLTDDYVRKDRDGRFTVKDNARKREQAVFGGAAGGLLVGALLKKPFEGLVVGTLAGIVAAESERKRGSGDLVLDRGQKIGVLIERDFAMYLREFRDNRRENRRTEQPDFEFEGRPLRFGERERPFRHGDTWMLPLERTAEQLGVSIDFTKSGVAWLEYEDMTVRMRRDDREIRVNGKREKLDRPMEELRGVWYVPIDVFRALVGDRIVDQSNFRRESSYE